MSVAAIAELVEGLDIALDRAEIRAAFAVRDQLDARLALAVAGYEAAGLPGVDGAVSINGWLRSETGRDPKSAAKVTWTGRKLRALPVLREAVLDGAISGGQLDVIVANVPVRHVERFADQEAGLVPLLVELTVDHTRRVMQHWKCHADALQDGGLPVEHENELHHSNTLAARSELRGSFDADLTATVDVSPAALGVLTCDSAYHRLLVDGVSGILDYGRATHDWPVDLYNAIVLRDGGCRFGQCDAPASWCDVHHILPWEDGGDTSIINGVMGCRKHHRQVHTPGYSIKLLPHGTTEYTGPDGRIEVSHPRNAVLQQLFPRRQPAGS